MTDDNLLQRALDETHPGHGIDVEKVETWLALHDARVSVNWDALYRRQKDERREREKAAQQERVDRAPRYTGTRIKSCQASVMPTRGAPYRCGHKPTRVVRDHRGVPMVVCTTHAKTRENRYTGWGGDPNPRQTPVEPEFVALLEGSEA